MYDVTHEDRRILFLTNVTSADYDDECGMRYWFEELQEGVGIINAEEIIPRLVERAVHDDLRTLATMEDISPSNLQAAITEITNTLTATDRQDTGKMEMLYRRLGWFAAFALFVEPNMRTMYETLPLPTQLVYDQDPLFVTVEPDRLLRDKITNRLQYREYMLVNPGVKDTHWLTGWQYKPRLHVSMQAINQYRNEHVTQLQATGSLSHAKVMGLNSGFYSSLDHKLVHPYVWGWYSKAADRWSGTRLGRETDWERRGLWEYPLGLVDWVQTMGEEIGRGQFRFSQEVDLSHAYLHEWTSRRVHRERAIRQVKEVCKINKQLRAIHFERRTAQCKPEFGRACPMIGACWDETLAGNPCKSGDYVSKTDKAIQELLL